MSDQTRRIDIDVPVLSRVEGEGALEVHAAGGRITDLKLRIFEPPRMFERFLEGRGYHEVADAVARICGICPVAYQMSAVQALESIFGVEPGDWVRAMRRVFYCGEWIQSHALHIHLLALPDFFGYDSALAMAADYPGEVRRGMRLQALGNELMALFGARAVHPVGARVGGFHHAPKAADVADLRGRLEAAIPEAEALARWAAGFDLPDNGQEFPCLALRNGADYPMNRGRIAASTGLDVPVAEFADHVTEEQVPHSTAFHARLDGEPYLVGPLARLNINADVLPAATRALLADTGPALPSTNPFHSLLARALEIHAALVEAVRLLGDYRVPERPYAEVAPRAGTGYGATEAPRGVLWHRYETDDAGRVTAARIVPPTAQNQARMEEDLRLSLEARGLDAPDDELRFLGERVIRNYDPCISCATHFLDLTVHRR
ncbi:Ni/Fe hydrogenase subunit alpha [Thiohalorhabdus denitrificans]|uniref:Coenzyme F420-reducing hydrogenase, alpha subunit n=1 Tax=Thiohalorhabdus denitrificans TaxID=381306 RepID=A0A0P9CL03_9GAMM|nr:nickel-dependent hydrogenase large subunit [Thiohalorhabdus denitrificans]KPV39667.1 Ni/Fe hydrogenase subunit alpha [Thiohalorhabdus denitrificans]SCX94785.1 Coenzyme F420-reducing hydrogenase, alpha subunit [Thiohalorhabdus denitrificans]